ncbi:hypothetical protein KY285_008178 [Solanum tuberosum]|nr:hypothetical protein KY285_008178 [Solanum tuberosum]
MKVEKELTREERVNVLKKQKVLNGRVFDPEIITKPGMCNLADSVEVQTWTHLFVNHIPILHEDQVSDFYYNVEFIEDGSLNTRVGDKNFHLNEERLGKILGVPMEGIRSVAGQYCSKSLFKYVKLMNGVYQLIFEFVNKVILPRSEKRAIASTGDLFFMEALCKFDAINLPAIMLERIHKTVTVKNGKHGMGYSYFLTSVFSHLEIPLEAGVRGTVKQTFSVNTPC